jgi:DNA ligase (NAD+)
VIIQRAGDVIPQVVGPAESSTEPLPEADAVLPAACPTCGSPVVITETLHKAEQRTIVKAFCPNHSCPDRLVLGIVHFVSKAGLAMDGVGEKWVEKLAQAGLLTSAADLFTLTREQLAGFERMGEKSAANFVDSVEQGRKRATLARFISALGIEDVGEQTAKALAQRYADMDALASAESSDLILVKDVGDKVAASIRAYFENAANRAMLDRFRDVIGLWPRGGALDASLPLSGQTFFFTGGLPDMPRPRAQALVERLGATCAGSVTKNVSVVVAGEKPTERKLAKARELGLRILDFSGFFAMLREHGIEPAGGGPKENGA